MVNPLILRGAAIILDAIFICLLASYLIRETRRRHLRARDWVVMLPPPMHFAVSVIVCDLGVLIYLAGWDVPAIRLAGVGVILTGALCKIRSISKPDYGDGPWLLSAGAVLIFALLAPFIGLA